MREYLFIGKRKDNGKCVTGNLVSTSPDEVFILLGITSHIKRDDYECYMVEVIPETVGQFTGLKDKNGKEIYEGNTLRGFKKEQNDSKGEHGFFITDSVCWRSGGFMIFDKQMQSGYTRDNNILYQFMWCNPGHYNTPDHYYQIDDIEVIGNVHDVNPASGQSGDNYMLHDPNVKAEEATTEEAAINAQESAVQDQATGATQDSEEGTTEG